MITSFVEAFEKGRASLRERFAREWPSDYGGIVAAVIALIAEHHTEGYGDVPDPSRIVKIDHGDYQGTLLFVVGAKGYQPDNYWFVKVGYGSCSGCDTFEAISKYDDELPTEDQLNQLMTLAVHVLQGLRPMQEPNG